MREAGRERRPLTGMLADACSMIQFGGGRIFSPAPQVRTIADLRSIARRRLPRPIFDYVAGGAGDERTVASNEQAFSEQRMIPRVLRDVSRVDTRTQLFGQEFALPLVLAPVGLVRSVHHSGEAGVALAAERCGVPTVVSMMSSMSVEAVAAHAPGADRWFQLYLWRDRAASERLLRRAALAGYRTVVLTVDVPVAGERLRDLRHGLRFPPRVPLRTALRFAQRPRWVWSTLRTGPVQFAAIEAESDDFATQTNRILDPAATLRELEWLRRIWQGPIVVKGVLSPQDAVDVRDAGADGVIVSNHGGRQLENAIATAHALPRVREAVGNCFPVLVDGGIRSGDHIAAAIALGADAVVVGRPYLFGLAAAGPPGVELAIEILHSGFGRAMALLGAAEVAALERKMVVEVSSPG